MNYAQFEYYLSASLCVSAMFGMGATLHVRDFWNVVRTPQAVALTLIVQVLISPFLAIGIAWLLRLPPGTAMGLLLIAALPGGSFSNVFAYLGKGNAALSVSATAVASLFSLITTAFVLRTFGHTQLPPGFVMPVGRILSEIGLWLLLPLSSGMLVRRFAPNRHELIAKIAIRVSLIVLAIFACAAVSSGRIKIGDYGWRTPVALVLFSIVSFWICYAGGFLLRLTIRDAFTVGIECVVRNVQLGILLAASLFPAAAGDAIGGGAMFALLFYGGSCLCIAGIEIALRLNRVGRLHGRMSLAEEARAAEEARDAEADPPAPKDSPAAP